MHAVISGDPKTAATSDDVAQGRRELAQLIGRLLAQQWLGRLPAPHIERSVDSAADASPPPIQAARQTSAGSPSVGATE